MQVSDITAAAVGSKNWVYKNAIPFDTANKMTTSGLRLGAAAVTSRGLGLEEMKIVVVKAPKCLRGLLKSIFKIPR